MRVLSRLLPNIVSIIACNCLLSNTRALSLAQNEQQQQQQQQQQQRHHTIRIGSRDSPLASAQARAVSAALLGLQQQQDDSSVSITTSLTLLQAAGDYTKKQQHQQQQSSTAGDNKKNLPLAVQAVDFTGVLDDALLTHQIDAAVHSLKDVPPTERWKHQYDSRNIDTTTTTNNNNNSSSSSSSSKQSLCIAAFLPRESPRDVLVGHSGNSIMDLPLGATVGTSSVRRQAQLWALRPDLKLINLRGNVETRLRALLQQNADDGTTMMDALVLAEAGLNRLFKSLEKNYDNIDNDRFSWLVRAPLNYNAIPPEEMLSAACQGIVAVVCRSDDTRTMEWLTRINDRDAGIAAAAERAFLDTLDDFSPSHYYYSDNDDNDNDTANRASVEKKKTPWVGRPPLAALMETRKKDNSDQDTPATIAKQDGDGEEDEEEWIFQGLLARPDGSKVLRDVQCLSSEIVTCENAARIGKHSAESLLRQAGSDFYQS